MSSIKSLGHLEIGKGAHLRFFEDTSKSKDDTERYYSETVCDGASDSEPVEVPLHWHRLHDEYMSCKQGSIDVTLDGRTRNVTPKDGELFIPRRAVHGFKFPKGEAAILRERTNPTGEFKQRFFEDVFDGNNWGKFGPTFRAFADGDTYIPVPGPFRFLDEVFMILVGVMVRLLYPRQGALPKSVAPSMPMEGRKEL